MTSYGPPYAQGPQAWGPPPNNGGYGPGPGGPGVTPQQPAAALWPIILVTVFFALFGLIPTILASNKASQQRQSTGRYWLAFGLSMLASIILYAIVVVVLVFVVLAGTVAVFGAAVNSIPTYSAGFPTPSSSPTATSTSTTTGAPVGPGATTGPCAYTPDGSASSVALPDDPATTPTDTRTWTLVTSAGTIVLELDGAAAPCTVQSIVHLTETGYYDDTPCPRSADSPGFFLLQCGDPTGTGAGGPGYTFGDEDLAAADYSAGSVAMANSGPDTNGSQFFLIDKDANSTLAKNYTVFGKITSGLDVLDKIVAAGNDGSNAAGGGAPTPPVDVVTATIS